MGSASLTSTDGAFESLSKREVSCWGDIGAVLDELSSTPRGDLPTDFSTGAAFVTFDYGIDGVSIEIAKYAACLERMLGSDGGLAPIHLVGGEFTERADRVLSSRWTRHTWPNSNGWSKWDDGRWFSRLFYEDLPAESPESREMAVVIWQKAVALTSRLSELVHRSGVRLLVPVNINSNPGNVAAALALVLSSEILDVCVLNSNHDFYWEGGSVPGVGAVGVRDHFFRNHENPDFFGVFTRLFPWNGRRWLQMNINARQSETLCAEHGFESRDVGEVGTAISELFFEPVSIAERREKRRSMGCILTDGGERPLSVSIDHFLGGLDEWMQQQAPVLLGQNDGLELDFGNDALTFFLQPTRVVDRKRIDRDCAIIQALFTHAAFVERFESNPERCILLHVSGPVPIEHQSVLVEVLEAYRRLLESVSESIGRRVFLSFSVGTEEHPAMAGLGLERLYIHDIYKLADMILFPSETEGRGLPIVESAASDVPIVCSRYTPEVVFGEVVGEHLGPEQRILHTVFPVGEFSPSLLQEVTDFLFEPEKREKRFNHNKNAVRNRYGTPALDCTFRGFLDRLLTP